MTNARPKSGEFYRHFKGKYYQVITIAKHSETGEELVVYQALYGEFGVCARPLEMFVSEVDRQKYPDVVQKFRFERVERMGNETAEVQPVATGTLERMGQDSRENDEVQMSKDMEVRGQKEEQEEAASPELLRFLDADTYEEKYQVLKGMEYTITDRLINDFAVILDVVIPEGELTYRYDQLKQCVATMARYESTRLR